MMCAVIASGITVEPSRGKLRGWQPVLAGPLKHRAIAVIATIAEELREFPCEDPSLAGGNAGIAILFAYLATTTGKSGDRSTALKMLRKSTNALEDAPLSASLYGGFTGIAWTSAHMERMFEIPISDSSEIDQALANYLTRFPWRDDYDLINGLVGLGIYALERLPGPAALQCLKNVIDRLDEIAEKTPDGITWFTSSDLLPEWQRKECPHGYYNLGLAHGVPGAIALLAHALAAGVQVRKSERLLQGSMKWMLQQKLAKDEGSYYSAWAGRKVQQDPCRTAWCYGDPGIAAALLSAARLVGEKSWEKDALKIMFHAAERPSDEAGVKDAGICHGSAGLGHIFNRAFQATGHPKFKKAAQFWLQHTLELGNPGKGIGGYQAYWPEQDGTVHWKKDPGILTGAAGIALTLLAATTPVEPEWDRMLLVNISLQTRIGKNKKEKG